MRERTKEGRSEGENGRILAHLYVSHMHIDTERARERQLWEDKDPLSL